MPHPTLVDCQRGLPLHGVSHAVHIEDPLENLGMTTQFPQSLGLRVKEET